MNREAAFAILVSAVCGTALLAAGWWPFREIQASSGRAAERRAWRRIWLPFVPALVFFAALCGWLLVEPVRAERMPAVFLFSATPFAVVLMRAVWRAFGSLALPRDKMIAATVGFFRPRIMLSRQFTRALDQAALAAALEHEQAHARHRDPLRIWLAEFGAALLWPSPGAAARLRSWRRALELARDEEARSVGVTGPDLATAILGSLRLSQGSTPASVAPLSDEAFVKERVMRLLQPLATELRPGHRAPILLLIVTIAVGLAVLLGIRYGEVLVRSALLVI